MKLNRLFVETDEKIRRLERQAASGDPKARAQFYRGRIRTGDRVKVAEEALLGNDIAREAFASIGIELSEPPTGLNVDDSWSWGDRDDEAWLTDVQKYAPQMGSMIISAIAQVIASRLIGEQPMSDGQRLIVDRLMSIINDKDDVYLYTHGGLAPKEFLWHAFRNFANECGCTDEGVVYICEACESVQTLTDLASITGYDVAEHGRNAGWGNVMKRLQAQRL